MKILHITSSSKGGAGIAAMRLHQALQRQGMASAYLSTDVTLDFHGETVEDDFFKYQRPSLFQKLLKKLQGLVAPSPSQKMLREFNKIEKELSYEVVSFPFAPHALENHPLVQEADILHLHWIGKLIDYPTFFKAIKKPIVWTLHDMNPFKGIFHYQIDEDHNSLATWINQQVFQLKKKAMATVSKGAIVTPSQWLLEKEKASGVFQHFLIHQCIFNSLGLSPQNLSKSEARKSLGISLDEQVILFSAATLDNPRKGLDLLQEALDNLTIPVTLLALGKGTLNTSNTLVKVIPLGFRASEKDIFECYAAADVFVLPSREDNLPNTMLESLAQGTPVISFGNGGMKEVILDGTYGKLVQPISAEALRLAMEQFFAEEENMDSEAIRNYAETQFNPKKQADAYAKVYQQLWI
ncbi:MAG: glycosyltransferase [Flavobacteriaceae bacterium]